MKKLIKTLLWQECWLAIMFIVLSILIGLDKGLAAGLRAAGYFLLVLVISMLWVNRTIIKEVIWPRISDKK